MDWSWSFALEIVPQLVEGVKITIFASLLGSVLAMLIGCTIAIARRSNLPGLSSALRYFVEFVRGTPLLVQLYVVFYMLPDIGIFLSPLTAGVITLGVHYSSYTSEVYRAGIDNVERGQWEAAKALNLSRFQVWRYVIIPQAVPPMAPALANYVISMFKETPLLSVITVVELMSQARIVANINYRYLEPITLVGAFFLAVSVPAVVGLRFLERHYGLGRKYSNDISVF
ncbi:ectoine/hydroxyectoine ABC transporter permease subunit EhuD [Bradyrhizobium canariense]|uniref:Ectoine/hydroxyectoine ABC transporter permease subunit EhuD n=1 Tax=Bradyrhizobium canariense TaxID=255045 RepID=A0A1X3HC51_9BRAD|nr:ectoine/hydroxyectoine ABC transporter permease subunit EhuD [Bradyrhizobium canariense]OSI73178.1 ectoine/hydroxyectoine ABC transporter permease subunit EhuD [Bradyrhizobium canariense]OSI81280.1 ectoine/hydroxyectoine ABC transporter permease subunit EhuD [Bradyrhizobium canariense]OSI94555.1 ectoine/hydroxyectoine ABC transporter permease subunit EhuD [Bradyrhizobium canariense]OSI95143.1 ectoine/hydroxyectoine ABC transporter permease subunit EhuD [Bradyrhizobium canariense]OSJ08188.1 